MGEKHLKIFNQEKPSIAKLFEGQDSTSLKKYQQFEKDNQIVEMKASYATQHLKKQQANQGQFNVEQSRRGLSNEERKQLLGDKDAYLEYLENQLDKVCEQSLVENPMVLKRVTELEQSMVQHEEKFANMTQLIKLLQSFAENQEEENRLLRESLNKPLSVLGKKMDSIQNDIAQEFRSQLSGIEQRETQREASIFESLSTFQKRIVEFESKIEQFANQLSQDMASDIKMLAAQIRGEGLASPMNNHQGLGESEEFMKRGMDKYREEQNKKIEYVIREMRKNAQISDVEDIQEKLKKEQKERTYLCKFVEDLTRKIDEFSPSLQSTKRASRNTSPSAIQESNQFKLIKQIESDIESLKEVVSALVEKIEDPTKNQGGNFVTNDQLSRMEKSLSDQIRINFRGGIGDSSDINSSMPQIDRFHSDQLSATRSQPNLLSNLKSDTYLPHDQDQGWLGQKLSHNYDSSQQHQIDSDLRDTLISNKYSQHTPALNSEIYNREQLQLNSFNTQNLGESFGVNQQEMKLRGSNKKPEAQEHKKKKKKMSLNSEALHQQPSKEEKKHKKDSSHKKLSKEERVSRVSDKENKKSSSSFSLDKRGRNHSASVDGSKNKKNKLHSSSHSLSKSPSHSLSNPPSTKSAAHLATFSSVQTVDQEGKQLSKLSRSSQLLEGNQKDQSKSSMTEPDDSKPQRIKKETDGKKGSSSKQKSPSPSTSSNKYAEKKKANEDKIKELFKKKKLIDSTSQPQALSSSVHHKSSSSLAGDKKSTGEKKKKS